MKASALLLLMVIFLAPVRAQSVPENVKTASAKKFPGMIEVEWEVANGIYLADFSHEEQYKTAKFDQNGNWLETRTYIEEDDLPASIITTVGNKYEDAYFESIMKVENNKKENFYDLIINSNDDVIFVTANQSGQVIKSEIQQAEDEIGEGEE